MSDAVLASAQARPTRFRWVVLLPIFIIYTIAAADRANIGFAMAFIRKEFEMTNLQAGALLSPFLRGYALGQIPSSFAIAKLGAHKLFSWAIVTTSAFTALAGLSSSPGMLELTRVGLGVAEAPLPTGVTTTINNWFPPREKGAGGGVFLSAVKFGPVIVSPICAAIVWHWSWREVVYFFAVPGLISSGVWWTLVANRPSESRFVNDAERDVIAGRSVAAAASQAKPARDFAILDRLIRARRVETLDTNAKVFRSWDIWVGRSATPSSSGGMRTQRTAPRRCVSSRTTPRATLRSTRRTGPR